MSTVVKPWFRMKELKYFEILAELKDLRALHQEASLQIRILSNIIVHQLGDVLEYVLLNAGIPTRIIMGNYVQGRREN